MEVSPHRRSRRVLVSCALTGAVVAATTALTGCEPVSNGLNSSAVAITTDRTATNALERLGFQVGWFSCTAELGEKGRSAAPTESGFASVDCEGETDSDQRITLKGRVTDERAGTCIRGDLTTRISGKVVFTATFLGDCESQPTRTTRPVEPPDRSNGGPRATVTVTETVTVTAEPTRK
ncbi:hypothetical protein ACFQ61_17335 [Streptomyces sp. NPDC056500]|uniref:hypothetical protein n=1 Tax=Streptomyces sp. NPDC056500 TaxID=3345840 RepID=UPI003687B642